MLKLEPYVVSDNAEQQLPDMRMRGASSCCKGKESVRIQHNVN